MISFNDTCLPNWGPHPHHPAHLYATARVCTAARVLCPISLHTPPGLCSCPINSPRPAHGGSWGRQLCVHARGALLLPLGVPLLSCLPCFVPVCSVRLRSRNPHPVPGDGNPTTSTQKRNLRKGVGLFMPLCANPGDGSTLLRKCRDATTRAPRATPGR